MIIQKSVAKGNVVNSTGINNTSIVGGAIGKFTGGGSTEAFVVRDSYSTVLVQGSPPTGGFIGQVLTNFPVMMERVFSTGRVSCIGSCTGFKGGFSGFQGQENYTSTFWDVNTSTQTQTDGPANLNAVGKTTSEMKTQGTYIGYDFINTWKMLPSSYPKLLWEPL